MDDSYIGDIALAPLKIQLESGQTITRKVHRKRNSSFHDSLDGNSKKSSQANLIVDLPGLEQNAQPENTRNSNLKRSSSHQRQMSSNSSIYHLPQIENAYQDIEHQSNENSFQSIKSKLSIKKVSLANLRMDVDFDLSNEIVISKK